MNGILLVDKPKGLTSFDVVYKLKKMLNEKKIGHAGTLDPMATGVLPIFIGRATKFISLIPDQHKSYLAVMKLGIRTDTMDITGNIMQQTDKVNISKSEIIETLKKFTGKIHQIPPMFSALKKDGVRLYDLARKGITIKREARLIDIQELDLISYNPQENLLGIKVKCSKGTYIRSLCDDIGAKLGCFATLMELRRIDACGFCIDETLKLEEIESVKEKGNMLDHIISVDSIFPDYSCVKITDPQKNRILNGNFLDASRLNLPCKLVNGEKIKIYTFDGEFIALAQLKENMVCPIKLNIIKV